MLSCVTTEAEQSHWHDSMQDSKKNLQSMRSTGSAPNNFRLRISADMAGVAMMAFRPTMTCGTHLTPYL